MKIQANAVEILMAMASRPMWEGKDAAQLKVIANTIKCGNVDGAIQFINVQNKFLKDAIVRRLGL